MIKHVGYILLAFSIFASAQTSRAQEVSPSTASVESAQQKEFKKRRYNWCKSRKREFLDSFKKSAARRYCTIWDESTEQFCPGAKGWCTDEVDSCACGKDSDVSFGLDGFQLPTYLGTGIAAVIVLLLLIMILKSYFGSDWKATSMDRFDPLSELADLEVLQTLPKTESKALLAYARERLGSHPKEAALLIQLALLKFFDVQGLASFHPSRTNGDYLRRLREYPDAQSLYRKVCQQTDRIRFDDGLVDSTLIPGLLAGAEEFTNRVFESTRPESGFSAISTVLPFIFILGTISTTTTGCNPKHEALDNTYPNGMSALSSLLEEHGFETERGGMPTLFQSFQNEHRSSMSFPFRNF